MVCSCGSVGGNLACPIHGVIYPTTPLPPMIPGPVRFGWVCPKCNAVMGPDTQRCLSCSPEKYTVTCGGGVSGQT